MCDGVGREKALSSEGCRQGVYMVVVVMCWMGRAELCKGLVWQTRGVRLV